MSLHRDIRREYYYLESRFGNFTESLTYKLYTNFICDNCGITCTTVRNKHNSKTYDHIVPKVKGGTNERTNLRVACLLCNNMKGDLDIEQFRDFSIKYVIPYRHDLKQMRHVLYREGLIEESKYLNHFAKKEQY